MLITQKLITCLSSSCQQAPPAYAAVVALPSPTPLSATSTPTSLPAYAFCAIVIARSRLPNCLMSAASASSWVAGVPSLNSCRRGGGHGSVGWQDRGLFSQDRRTAAAEGGQEEVGSSSCLMTGGAVVVLVAHCSTRLVPVALALVDEPVVDLGGVQPGRIAQLALLIVLPSRAPEESSPQGTYPPPDSASWAAATLGREHC
jgi:hypothetical protein